MDGVKVVATATDARARLNLNRAAPEELRALFAALGWEPGRAGSRAAAVARWRAAHLPPVEAAPDTTRIRLRPPPGAFAAVEDLRAVPGMTEAEYLARRAVPDGGQRRAHQPEHGAGARAAHAAGHGRAGGGGHRGAQAPRAPQHGVRGRGGAAQGRAQAGGGAGGGDRGAAGSSPRARRRYGSWPRAPARPVRARIWAVAVMTGGTRLPVVQVVER